jgi:amino acid transporter
MGENDGSAPGLTGIATQPSMGAPRPTLKARDVLAITVGIVIGAGIFRTPALVAGEAGSEAAMLLAWTAGGLLSIVGALCYAELSSTYPSMGGDFHFLDRAFGPRVAFLYGWARLAVIQTGSIALLAYVSGDYLAAIFPIGLHSSAIYAAIAVILIGAINWLGVRQGAGMQRWLTVAEVGGLLLIVIAGLLIAPAAPPAAPPQREGALGLMMVFVLLTYGGWSETVYVSAELEDSPRRLGRIMVAGLALVILLYLLANLAFLRALGLAGMAASDAVAAEVMRRATGESGAILIGLIVSISALTSANATAITGARTNCALGRSFPALRWLGSWDTDRDTPGNALIVQSAVALLLVIAGAFARDGFRLVVEYTAPVFWLFMLLTGLSLFILRVRDPSAERPVRVPLFPFFPAIFCLTNAYLLYSSLAYTGAGAIAGVAVLATGLLLLLFLRPVPRGEDGSPGDREVQR